MEFKEIEHAADKTIHQLNSELEIKTSEDVASNNHTHVNKEAVFNHNTVNKEEVLVAKSNNAQVVVATPHTKVDAVKTNIKEDAVKPLANNSKDAEATLNSKDAEASKDVVDSNHAHTNRSSVNLTENPFVKVNVIYND